jgi:hypothetical protein
MKDKDEKTRLLEGQLVTHSIFIETLIEMLYEKNIIDKTVFEKRLDEKVKLIAELTKSAIKKKQEDPENPMFYGPHGEA